MARRAVLVACVAVALLALATNAQVTYDDCMEIDQVEANDSLNGFATWPQSPYETNAMGVCIVGYLAQPGLSPSRNCLVNGAWGPVINPCVPEMCPVADEEGVFWPSSPSFTTVQGACKTAYSGNPERACLGGTWAEPTTTCNFTGCLGEVFNGISFPNADKDFSTVGICSEGSYGSPERTCLDTNLWSTEITGTLCAFPCPAVDWEGASYPETLPGSTANGNCNGGSTGAPSMTCSLEGNWMTGDISGSACTTACPSEEFDNALWPETQPGIAYGQCLYGTVSASSPQRECIDGSGWSSSVTDSCYYPGPSTCSSYTDGDNVQWPTTSAGSYAYGFCPGGLEGQPQQLCQEGGVWSMSVIGVCTGTGLFCPQLFDPNVIWQTTAANQVGAGECQSGYVIPGRGFSPQRMCNNDGVWGEVLADCVIGCPEEQYANAVWPAAYLGSLAYGECIQGYAAPEGEQGPQRICNEVGLWEEMLDVECFALPQCGAESAGNAVWPKTVAGEIAEGACESGYATLAGTSPTRACNMSGSWEPVPMDPPLCVQMCPQEVAGNAQWPQTLPGNYGYGECLSGFLPTGQVLERYCNPQNSQWMPVGTVCNATCPTQVFANAEWPVVAVGAIALGVCKPGFAGNPSRVCVSEGMWDDNVTAPCTPTDCLALPSDGNAAWPMTAINSVATGTCNGGYAGSPTRTCGADGTWGPISNACGPLYCPAELSSNVNWPMTMAGQTTFGTCIVGYSGTLSRLCNVAGTWNEPTGQCDRLKCPAFNGTAENVMWPETLSGEVGIGSCVAGTSGSPKLSCGLDGMWGSKPTGACAAVVLNCLGDTYQGITWPTTANSATATGTCPAGSQGAPTRQCMANGAWSGEVTGSCTAFKCPMETFAFATWSLAPAGSSAPGACAAGYGTPNGQAPMRECKVDATWSNTVTNGCVLLRCPSLTAYNATWPLTYPGSMAYGTCVPGFELVGDAATRMCDAQGQWTTPQFPNFCKPSSTCANPITMQWPLPVLTTTAGAPLTLAVDVRYAPCFNAAGRNLSITYAFTSPPVAALASLFARGGPVVAIPAGVLPAGTHMINATLLLDGVAQRSATVKVTATALPPQVILANQATKRIVAADQHNVINATLSRNPNPGGSAPTCQMTCSGAACPFTSESVCVLTIKPNAALANQQLFITVTVTAVTFDQTRSASVTVQLDFVETLLAVVSITVPNQSPSGLVNPSQAVRLLGSVAFATPQTSAQLAALTMKWTHVAVMGQNEVDLDNPDNLIGGTESFNLAIKPNVLTAGTYTLRLTVTTQVGQSYAQLELRVNAPPTAGTLTVNPLTGTSLETQFVLRVEGANDPENEDLLCQYGYVRHGSATPTLLFPTPRPLFEISLSALPGGNYSIFSIVYDASGASVRGNSVNVTVLPPSAAVTTLIDTQLEAAVSQQDPSAILQIINIVAAQLESGDSDSAQVRRSLVKAIETAAALTALDGDSTAALLQTLARVTENPQELGEDTSSLILQLLNTLASRAGSAASSFLSIISNLLTYRATADQAPLSAAEAELIQASVQNVFFSLLADVACGEPATVVEGSGLSMLASLQRDFANATTAAQGVGVQFGEEFALGDGAAFDQSACHQLHQTAQSENPYGYAANASFSALGNVLNVNIFSASGDAVEVSGLSENEAFRFRFDLPADVNASEIACVYWNTSTSDWDTAGCSVASIGADYIECLCSHLTTFTIGKAVLRLNLVDPANDIVRLADLPRTAGGIATIASVCSLLVLFVAALAFAIYADRRDRARDAVPTLAELGKYINRYVELYARPVDFNIVETRCLAEYVRIFEFEKYEKDRRPTTWEKMRVHIIFGLRSFHAWVSIFFRPLTNYTRAERVVVAFSIIFGSMAANALFYQYSDNPFDAEVLLRRFITAIFSSLIVFVPTSIIGFLFKRVELYNVPVRRVMADVTESDIEDMHLEMRAYLRGYNKITRVLFTWTLPWWSAIILHGIAFVGSALCIYVTMLYGATFSETQATAWIESFFISIALSIGVWQPIKALLGTTIAWAFGGTVVAASATIGMINLT